MKQKVNYINHQKNVFLKMIDDNSISCQDIAVYQTLFMIWNSCGFKEWISISRSEIMQMSKIGSVTTYLKSLKTLHNNGYLEYKPSNNPMIGSKVNLYRFDTTDGTTRVQLTEQLVYNSCTTDGTTRGTLHKHNTETNKKHNTETLLNVVNDRPNNIDLSNKLFSGLRHEFAIIVQNTINEKIPLPLIHELAPKPDCYFQLLKNMEAFQRMIKQHKKQFENEDEFEARIKTGITEYLKHQTQNKAEVIWETIGDFAQHANNYLKIHFKNNGRNTGQNANQSGGAVETKQNTYERGKW